MVRIKVDGKEIDGKQGELLIEVMRENGIEVPSMCHLKGLPHFSSCMVCVVKDGRSGKLIPSCSLKAEEGMEIISGDEEVREARKTSLELLLSEHVGDCEAPCRISCPAHMDIPLMNRLLAKGDFDGALEVVLKDIALPGVLGRVCSAPCEGACRRRPMDGAVSICLLKRYAGDHGYAPKAEKVPDSGKKVMVVGAGPAGLAAAWQLVKMGHRVVLTDRNLRAGGSLLKEVDTELLPAGVLEREVAAIARAGVKIQTGLKVGTTELDKYRKEYDAVILCTGKGQSGLDKEAIPGEKEGVFMAGSVVKPLRMAIRALGQGKDAAYRADQFLRDREIKGEYRRFNSRFGKLLAAEHAEYLKESDAGQRLEPELLSSGFSKEQVMEEASRCLHCDCRDMQNCKLRLYSENYGAQQKRFASEERILAVKVVQHEKIIYEPSKCIKCGLCVRLSEQHSEEFGFTFIGRGFDVVVDVPFSEPLDKGLQKLAGEVVEACPTGALCLKDGFTKA